MSKKRHYRIFFLLFFAILLLFTLNLFIGSVSIPIDAFIHFFSSQPKDNIYHTIIVESRLPQALTAIFVGASLSVAGLLMQTLFRNPLAGPGILGVSSGASLGVAIFTLMGGFGLSSVFGFILNEMNLIIAASLGSFLSLGLVLLFSKHVKNNISLLIIGLMIGYLSSSFIGFLQFISHQEQIHSFVLWGLGSFSNVSSDQIVVLSIFSLMGIFISFLFIKPLNLLLLGENYASNLGINIKRTRFYLILLAGILTAVSTAYAGPIAFIGLAVPHLSRMIFKESDHRILLPGIVLTGIAIALACNLIAKIPGLDQAIPINTVTSLFGAPLVIYFIIKSNRFKINAS